MSAPASDRSVVRRRLTGGLAALTTLALLPALAATAGPPASAEPAAGTSAAPSLADVVTPGDPVAGKADVDPDGVLDPTSEQLAAAEGLGVADLRWSRLGSPTSLLPQDGVLGTASGSPQRAARTWLEQNAATFGLSSDQMAGLELVNVQQLARGTTPAGDDEPSPGVAVLFRQTIDELAPARDGQVTVGVTNGDIVYVSSSLARSAPETVETPELSLAEGWLAAAANVGLAGGLGVGDLDLSAPADPADTDAFTTLTVPGFAQAQQARLRYLAVAGDDPDAAPELRPVVEANVVKVGGGDAQAYTVLVDAVGGKVLSQLNQVDNAVSVPSQDYATQMYNNTFSGTVSNDECGPEHEFELTDGKTRTINLVGVAAPTDDIVVKLFDPDGEPLVSGDLATSPEVATYTADAIPAGTYSAQVCPFDAASITVGTYQLFVSTNDNGTPSGGPDETNPEWRYFTATPSFDSTAPGIVPRNTAIGCWFDDPQPAECTDPPGHLDNLAAPYKWDELSGSPEPTPTTTTVGNNANTHEAWGSPLTPGGTAQAPISPTRQYTARFTDAWNESECSPAELVPTGNDINQSVTNLFVAHNRMHDYSYFLGFTEENYNLQLDNFGKRGADGDQEIGNAQAGAVTGGFPTYLGRDNANQIALQDGIPGITNQYLFQPIAGAFYAPCVDGGLDMGIVGHEYTHAISNRMIGGPDEGITSEQGGAMGESWSDLVAGEYMFSHGYNNAGNPWAIGVYATGNQDVAIRDYAIDDNPLNYSDYGFDTTGPEVHADGEIWNGTLWSVRQALVQKYQAEFPYGNKALQLRCAQGRDKKSPLAALYCPGNRRWVTMIFDSFLLQQGATSMLDARDAMLASDRMRFQGRDLPEMWKAFASRGMGGGASTPTADSDEPVPSFTSPLSRNARVTFAGAPGSRVYVGDYEARATPVADLRKGTELGAAARFAPGTYRMLQVSPQGGFKRFTMKVRSGGGTQTVKLARRVNLSSAAGGASVIDATEGSVNADMLIDGTESTNWSSGPDNTTSIDETTPFVSVDLAGGTHRITKVQVSALLRPAGDTETESDETSGNRFTALRKFAIEVCTTGCDSDSARWKRVYVSRGDAFPGVRPRPVAPNQTMRGFSLGGVVQAAAVRLVALENQCTGFAGYAGEQDEDPSAGTDCKADSDEDLTVHAAELQVFGKD